MVICGLKLTHDGAITVIDNGRLVFCYEMEKIGNSPRFSELKLDFPTLRGFLAEHGYNLEDIDQIVIDGWGDEFGFDTGGEEEFKMEVDLGKGKFTMDFAGYGHIVTDEDLLEREDFDYSRHGLKYSGYRHVSGHVLGAYCTSPFAAKGEDSFILSWDGGMVPQLFYFHYESGKVENIGPLFFLMGYIYPRFAMKYPPYDQTAVTDITVAGKFMAYIALGRVQEKLLAEFMEIFARQSKETEELTTTPVYVRTLTQVLIERLAEHADARNYKPEDTMATFHHFLRELLIRCLKEKVSPYPEYTRNLCFSGGCALNIKWNSAIRESGIFDRMWVPPFPNDSGSAIGTACCEMINRTGLKALDWNVYSGPPLADNKEPRDSWKMHACSLEQLARFLHHTGEPVVFLHGKAELGPRALGNRSILAPAVNPDMKDRLNKIKNRANYRPVAPICIEEDAPLVFAPGSPDPLMLYDHDVRSEWVNRIPAVIHLDGSSRIQTVNRKENEPIYELLTEYKKLSGIPLLCNTSANFKGKGFFPDVHSVMVWDQVNFLWSDYNLYIKSGFEKLFA